MAFTLEYTNPSFRTPSEVFSELNIPVLAAVPHKSNGFHGNGNGNRNKNGSAVGNGNGVQHSESATHGSTVDQKQAEQ
jgi:hypothetical protein